jgi:hypothetical protein
MTPSLRFPLQAGGTEPTRPTRFPSRSGGNLKEGGNCKLCPCNWYKMRQELSPKVAWVLVGLAVLLAAVLL